MNKTISEEYPGIMWIT